MKACEDFCDACRNAGVTQVCVRCGLKLCAGHGECPECESDAGLERVAGATDRESP